MRPQCDGAKREEEMEEKIVIKTYKRCAHSFPFLCSLRCGTRRERGDTCALPMFPSGLPVPRPARSNRIFPSISPLWRTENRRKHGRRFWSRIPFPPFAGGSAIIPARSDCNRKDYDEALAINALERFLGDWGMKQRARPSAGESRRERKKSRSSASGPAGLSCAYFLARKGYGVTVFEAMQEPGGMLRYGIPQYRLPQRDL